MMKHQANSRFLKLLAASAVAVAATISVAGPALAQWKPDRAVEFVVPFSAGGGNDRVARVMAQILQEKNIVEVPVNVVNKPGASGAVGLAYVAGRQGDPTTVTITSTTSLSAHILGNSPVNYTDLTPITLMIREPIAIGVRSSSDIQSFKELAARLKEDPKSLSVTPGAGLGIPNHVAISLALRAEGVRPGQLRTVVFNSGSEAATAVLGGHVDVVSASVNNVKDFSDGLRILAVTSDERLDTLPDVPTLKELGIDVTFGFNRYVFAPAGITPEQVAYWEEALNELKATPEWKEQLKNNAWTSSTLSASEVEEELASTYKDLQEVLTELGLVK